MTTRVRIETLAPGHAGTMFQLLADPEIYRYLDEDPPSSVEALEQRYEVLVNPASPPDGEVWLNWVVVVDSPENSTVVGTVQATVALIEPSDPEGSGAGRRAEIAYVFAPRYWGRGLARRAVELMLLELAERHGVANATATIDARNARSLALVRGLGFAPAGPGAAEGTDLEFELAIASGRR